MRRHCQPPSVLIVAVQRLAVLQARPSPGGLCPDRFKPIWLGDVRTASRGASWQQQPHVRWRPTAQRHRDARLRKLAADEGPYAEAKEATDGQSGGGAYDSS